MFPSVIPLYGTDCSRVTHPSAAGISSVQALRISPLDLHVLSTPPAFVLSQDQTLMFNPSTRSRSPSASGSPKPSALIALACCLLSQNLTVPALTPPSVAPPGSLALLFLLCIVFKVRSPPFSRAPQRSTGPLGPALALARFKRQGLLYQNPCCLSSLFSLFHCIPYFDLCARKSAIYSVFWQFFPDFPGFSPAFVFVKNSAFFQPSPALFRG